jgi:hypothetical protein
MTKKQFLKIARKLAKNYGYNIYCKKLKYNGGLHYFWKKKIEVRLCKNVDHFIFGLSHELAHMILANKGKLKKLHGTGKVRRYRVIGTKDAAKKAVKDEIKVDKYAHKLIIQLTGSKSPCLGGYLGTPISENVQSLLSSWKKK